MKVNARSPKNNVYHVRINNNMLESLLVIHELLEKPKSQSIIHPPTKPSV